MTKLYLQDRFDSKAEEYKDNFAALGRRYNSVSSIDVCQIKINKDSVSKISSTSIYKANDNFYSTSNAYWNYKYTSPIELMLIANHEFVPKNFINNPVDFPVHAWLGKETYLVTDKKWNRPDRPELDTTSAMFAEIGQGDTVAIFHDDRLLFQPIITLLSLKRSKNSFMVRGYEDFKTRKYSIDFSDISKDELLGHYLSSYLKGYFLKQCDYQKCIRKGSFD